MCPAPMMIMKYDENPHATAAKRELYHLQPKQRHMMKKPSIMANRRLAGAGSQREYALPIQLRVVFAGYEGAIWKFGIPEKREFVHRVDSPVSS